MNLIPLFDPNENERIQREFDLGLRKENSRIQLFPEKKHSQIKRPQGNWEPQDACGGHQWNARLSIWQRD